MILGMKFCIIEVEMLILEIRESLLLCLLNI